MKKNVQFNLRIGDLGRRALHDLAEQAGVDASKMVRAMIEREAATGDILRSMQPRPVDEGGWEVRISDLIGREWTILWQTDGIRPYIFAWIGGRYHESGNPRAHLTARDLSHLRPQLANEAAFPKEHLTASLEMLRLAGREDFDWDDPHYRNICKAFGFDPDRGRPVFAKRGKFAAKLLLSIISQDRPDPDNVGMAARIMWQILREDRPTPLQDWESVMEKGGHYYQARIGHPGLRRAGRHLRPPSMTDLRTYPNYAHLELLPSRHGRGYLATIHFALQKNVKGVAVIPAKMDKLRNRTLVKICANDDIVWLSAENAETYLESTGRIWKEKHEALEMKGSASLFLDQFRQILKRIGQPVKG